MYIRKSVLSAVIITAGVCVLIVLASLFCFTETKIPAPAFCGAWTACLLAMASWVKRLPSGCQSADKEV